MPRKRDDAGKCLDAALTLAVLKGWRQVSLYDIAEESGLSLAEARTAVRGRHGVIRELAARADAAMLAAVDQDWPSESVRDRLFTLLMARFDYLRDRREGLRALLASAPTDPCGALRAAAGPGRASMRLALESAGISSAGILGALRVNALGAAYAAVLRSFLDDDTGDLAKTMAALDRRLASLARLAERFDGFNGRARNQAAPESGETA